jgi:tetratricopeptide (TPR) repeat protein
MMRRKLYTRLRAHAFRVALFGILVTPAAAQVPDSFTNLRVLPKEITKPELIATMREFSGALGVRCGYCHVDENDPGRDKDDFASDEKAPKKAARLMWTMVKDINERQLSQIEVKAGESRVNVVCETCHRGQARPILIQDLLVGVCRSEGVDSAVARYRALRSEYYGSETYDFSEFMLLDVASTLADSGDVDAAFALLDLNLEQFPGSAYTLARRGMLHAHAGDREAALDDLNKALELRPEDRRIRRMIEDLKAGK